MQMIRVENIEIAIAVYITLGVAIIHATLYSLIFPYVVDYLAWLL